MPDAPTPSGGGMRQRHAAQIRTEVEAKRRREEESAKAGEAAQSDKPGKSDARATADKHERQQQETQRVKSAPPPEGAKMHAVRQGEYLSLIAKQYGVPWQRIWDDPVNAELRQRRKTANILYPGDELFIPETRVKSEPGKTEMRHRFRLRGEQNQIRLILRDTFDEPISDVEYRLSIPGREDVVETTGKDGRIEASVPADVRKVHLFVLGQVHELEVGALDPVARLSGVQQRLKNLGFDCGPVDGKYGPRTRSALLRFQQWAEHEPTGLADKETREKLEAAHEGFSRGLVPEDEQGSDQKVEEKAAESSVDEAVEDMDPSELEDMEEDQ